MRLWCDGGDRFNITNSYFHIYYTLYSTLFHVLVTPTTSVFNGIIIGFSHRMVTNRIVSWAATAFSNYCGQFANK